MTSQAATDTIWINPSREEMVALVERCSTVRIGVLASGRQVVTIGDEFTGTNRWGQPFRSFAFHCPAALVPVLADRAEELGRADFAAGLRAALADNHNLATWDDRQPGTIA